MKQTIDARTTSAARSDNGSTSANHHDAEHIDVVVIGGGQAGLATGYFLARRHQEFVILESNPRIGDNWRQRWDSLRLFTPARYDGLPGMRFPAPGHSFPGKDGVADYLETYARQMKLPVRTGVQVRRVTRDGDDFLVATDRQSFRASRVVVASGAFRQPNIPSFAAELDPAIRQVHSSQFRNAGQLKPGAVLVVGASNSGAEIAFDAAREHRTWLSGRDTGTLPFQLGTWQSRILERVVWFAFNHVLTIRTPIGRKAQPYVRAHGGPLEWVKSSDLAEAGVERVYDRTAGVRDGKPILEDGRVLDVANVVWCTGFRPDFSWIELPVFDKGGWPIQQRGEVSREPGLYFVGLPFLYSMASPLVGGVGRDAAYVAKHLAARAATRTTR